jgi:SAM-dependent methyltransferase
LGDWTSTTPFDRHYFYQGAWLARCLAQDQPSGHVDVGSSVSLVSVLSAVTDTLHIDYRPLEVELPGLRCMAGDILKLPLADESVSSLSSLHVIEHIGLGRYGDPIDAQGSRKAAVQLARVLRPGGCLYVSVPIGRERICFNAHRVFAAESVVAMFSSLQLEEFAFVDDRGAFQHRASLESVKGLEFGCGMFKFTKTP